LSPRVPSIHASVQRRRELPVYRCQRYINALRAESCAGYRLVHGPISQGTIATRSGSRQTVARLPLASDAKLGSLATSATLRVFPDLRGAILSKTSVLSDKPGIFLRD